MVVGEAEIQMVPLSWLLVRWGRVTLSGLCMVVGEAEIQMVPLSWLLVRWLCYVE